jgi:hypothetical protein
MDVPNPNHPAERSRRARSVWVVFLLVFSTLAGLVLSWAWPHETIWQFWVMTQLLPLIYLILSIWAAWPVKTGDPP